MNSRNHTSCLKSRSDIHCFNIPVECIRRTRALNLDRHPLCISWEVYKILKSNNGRKIFT